ncbi:shikimate dehydrogenase [Azospirillum sp. RWY-5-1]|uniref:shikimate dehydrogenase (NADP(+)) n=1 Tax=Azospirillum oleiclasticum TaxID=2735135 RepID=A0ABX2T2D4_9PROT|nr:shikimate dehydrogenase [Azospirillum oleiclasticum]NYZ11300.1 shikimate dehydrogenase [Azospirillum oleiclasticum]NYZ18461.1 shikimate dehydrogenase [Azospirillum oleiclasticum]
MSALTPVREIDGRTRIVPLLAHPSHHLRTPAAFNRRCAALGVNAVCIPWQVEPRHLAETVGALRHGDSIAGLIVTVPHKAAVAELCDELTGDARHLRVANVVRRGADGRLVGAMFDGVGYVAGLRHRGIEPAGRRVLLVGAGGAATAIAGALAGAGVAELAIANRSAAKAERVVDLLRDAYPSVALRVAPPDPAGFDLVVNATSLGMQPTDALPVDPARIDVGAVVAEVVMQPAVTPLLVAAQARGLAIHEGEHMLTAQLGLLAGFLFAGAAGEAVAA